MQTKDEGIYCWRDTPRNNLPPLGPLLPTCYHANNYKHNDINAAQHQKSIIQSAVDSDFVLD